MSNDRPDGTAFRFSPPEWCADPDLDTALQLAFGCTTERSQSQGSQRTWRWIEALDLAPRIGFRHPPDQLRSLLGASTAAQLLASARSTTARAVLIFELIDELEKVSRELGQRPLLLKGAALLAAGWSLPGARPVGDLDLLADSSTAELLAERLVERGFVRASLQETEHHLPVLSHPTLGSVEIHLFLPGVFRLDVAHSAASAARASLATVVRAAAAVDQLPNQDRGDAPDKPPAIRLPRNDLLAGHLIVHALDQHARSPQAYPPLRIVSDLLDLTRDAEPGSLEELMQQAAAWTARRVSQRELEALAELCSSLSGGELPAGSSDAHALLGHIVLGCTSANYRRRLRATAIAHTVRKRDWKKLGRRINSSLR